MTASPSVDVATAWRLVRTVAESAAAGPLDRVADGTGSVLDLRTVGSWSMNRSVDAEASELLDLYLSIARSADLTIAQIGQSLDGRVATESGHSHYVTGSEDIRRLHRLRALVDAVVVGASTATADRPRLTVRAVEGAHPVRVVLDPSGRVEPTAPPFSDGDAPTLWVRRGLPSHPLADHVTVVEPPDPEEDGLLAPHSILQLLRARGLRRILVEGGGITVSRFLAASALDRLHVTVAPLVIGSGRQGLTLPPVATLAGALRPRCRHFMLGADVLFDLDLRAPADPGLPG